MMDIAAVDNPPAHHSRDSVTSPSQVTESSADGQKRTHKKRLHHVQSRYLQATNSSTKKLSTPRVSTTSSSGSHTKPLQEYKSHPTTVRKALFKETLVIPAKAPDELTLKIRKPHAFINSNGPMIALPTAVDENENQDVAADDMESDLLLSSHLCANFLRIKAESALEQLSLDAPNKLWSLMEMNRELASKKTGLEVEINRSNFLILFREHLSKQQEMQCKLKEELARLAHKSCEIAAGVDACLHYLPLRNLQVPQSLVPLNKSVDHLNKMLESTVSKISPYKSYIEELAELLLGTKTTIGKQVETLNRLREVLGDAQKASGELTFHMVKEMQERMMEADYKLCEFDFLSSF